MQQRSPDAWANPADIDAVMAEELCEQLEKRARFSDQIEINDALIASLHARTGQNWLEVGCGTGVLCRQLAPSLLPDGSVTGVDASGEIISQAWDRVPSDGSIPNLRLQMADGSALPFPDGTFDGVFSARLLLHVPDPVAILREMARVVSERGTLVAMEWDFDSITVDVPDRDTTRAILHWRTDNKDGNNWIGRQLYRHVMDAGWQNVVVDPRVSVAHTEQTSLVQSLRKAATGARDEGAIDALTCEAWLESLDRALESGWFFASIVYFIVRGSP